MTFDPQAAMDALAPVLGLNLDGADRDAVARHLAVAAQMARLVQAVELPEDAEPLPVARL